MKGLLNRSIFFCLMALSLGLTSCLDDAPAGEDPYKRLEADIQAIDAALLFSSNVIKDPTGIRIEVHQLGTGLPARVANKVKIDYVGKLFATDAVFDERTWNDKLENTITGWKIAFSILPAGSIATIYVPSGYAYGNRRNGDIPANSILKFDVNFKEVSQTSTEADQLKKDTIAIDNYIANLNNEIEENIVHDSTGVRYAITKAGTGDEATWYDQITLSYKIKLLDNPSTVVVDVASRAPSEQFKSRLVDYINGMKVGLSKMNIGSKATLFIPSGLAFGAEGAYDANGSRVITEHKNLIVEVEVTNISYKSL